MSVSTTQNDYPDNMETIHTITQFPKNIGLLHIVRLSRRKTGLTSTTTDYIIAGTVPAGGAVSLIGVVVTVDCELLVELSFV